MKVLFVCTGNTFRSASVEYLFNKFLKEKNDDSIIVSSAGTKGYPPGMFKETVDELKKLGVDASNHHYKILNKQMLDESDLVICMSLKHKKFIKENFAKESILFNEILKGENSDVADDYEAGIDHESNEFPLFIHNLILYINKSIPIIYSKLKEMNL